MARDCLTTLRRIIRTNILWAMIVRLTAKIDHLLEFISILILEILGRCGDRGAEREIIQIAENPMNSDRDRRFSETARSAENHMFFAVLKCLDGANNRFFLTWIECWIRESFTQNFFNILHTINKVVCRDTVNIHRLYANKEHQHVYLR